MFQSNAFQSFAFQSVGFAKAIIGGHFIPKGERKRHTLSNVYVIYEKAKELPRKETKELRDSIADFIEPVLARQPILPEIHKVDYKALESNEKAYEKFSQALSNIQERLEIMEQTRLNIIAKPQAEDDELLLMATIASIIH